MAFIEPMHRNKPNITYLLTLSIICQAVYGVLFFLLPISLLMIVIIIVLRRIVVMKSVGIKLLSIKLYGQLHFTQGLSDIFTTYTSTVL